MTRSMRNSKIELSETIRFGEARCSSTQAARPALEIDLATGRAAPGERLGFEARFDWPGPGAVQLVDVAIHLSGTWTKQDKSKTFVQAAEAAHGATVQEGQTFALPVSLLIPEEAVAGAWRLAARIIVEGGAVFTAQTPVVVS